MCGQAIFFVFDFFRSLRKSIKHTKIMVAAEDALFCLIAFKMFFDLLYLTNNGHMRWYIPASLISGFVIYFFILSKYVIKLWGFAIKLSTLFLSPLFKILKLISKAFLKIKNVFKSRILALFTAILTKFRQFAAKKPTNPHKTRI